ncbi:MAG: creatininase family protein [Candidatus Methanofastidiosia archaeon]
MYLETLTSKQFERCQCSCAVIPVGTIEAHGNHMPLGTDNIIPAKILSCIEEEIGDEVLLAPPIHYGHTYFLEDWPGSINIPTDVLRDYIVAVGKEINRNGINKILFLNGHGGNIRAMEDAAELLSYNGIRSRVVNWWEEYSEEIKKIAPGTGHGGEDETSLMLACDEKLVDMTQAKSRPMWPLAHEISISRRKSMLPDGMTGDATSASTKKGNKIYKIICSHILMLIKELTEEK